MSFQQYGMCDQQSLRSTCAYAQSDQSLCLSLEYPMGVKLLTEHHLRFLSLKRDCTGSYESTLVKMPHCWKSRVTAHLMIHVFDLLTSPQGHQFDPRVKILLAYCSTHYPRLLIIPVNLICHMTMFEKLNFDPMGT